MTCQKSNKNKNLTQTCFVKAGQDYCIYADYKTPNYFKM